MKAAGRCELLDSRESLDKILRTKDKLFVLFYASWCPFSQAFLPDFIDHAESDEPCYSRILVDDKDDLIRKYSIDVFPTVLYFEKGRVVKRLDGEFHVGLNKRQLKEFVQKCRVP